MSGNFPNFISNGNVFMINEGMDIEQDSEPVQEQQCTAPSQQHITVYNHNVGTRPSNMYSSQHPIAVSGTRGGQQSVSLFKCRNQDIAPQVRKISEEYKAETNRLKTFTDWPRNAAVSKDALVKNGFIYLHSKDRVQCVFCRGVLSDWEIGDIVENEHKTHCPECRFAFGYECRNIPLNNTERLPQQTVYAHDRSFRSVPASPQIQRHATNTRTTQPLNVGHYNTTVNVPVSQPLGQAMSVVTTNRPNTVNLAGNYLIRGEGTLSDIHHQLESRSSFDEVTPHGNVSDAKGDNSGSLSRGQLDNSFSSSPSSSLQPGQFGIRARPPAPVVGPKYPQWEDLNTRIRSFRGWPAQMTQVPIELAQAGLLYMGKLA